MKESDVALRPSTRTAVTVTGASSNITGGASCVAMVQCM